MSRIEPPRVETKPMRFLTHAEVALLADSIDQRYRPLVLLAAYGGLRAGELLGLVSAAPGGGYLRGSNFRRRMWAPAVKRAGLAPLRLHDLRHTCASLAIAAGADIKVLQRMLGHSSAALTLDRYGHLMPGQAEAVAARLDQLARAARVPEVTEETDGDGHESDAP